MPLVRLQVRNEFGLGKPELYSEVSREDPKAVLDGVAVSGLVGILRQLGDLAEFSAEVFHGLQEQVTTTASRSQNLMVRVQRIEAALPPLEKRVLAQTSHLHFAYTAGSDWHARIRNEQHHFIDNDLPRFIMDSYEECRDPPRLHLLDKFDTGGPGSCLRRYSDPTFFRRVSTKFDELDVVKIQNEKSHKIKKKRSFTKNGEYSRGTSMSKSSSRMQFSSPAVNGRTSPTVSVDDLRFKSGMEDRVNSFDSRSGSGYIECVFNQNENVQLEELGSNRSSSSRMMRHEASVDSVYQDEENLAADSSSAQETSQDHVASNASCVSWEEKTEIVEPSDRKSDQEEPSAMISTYSDVDQQEEEVMDVSNVSDYDVQCAEDNMPKSFLHENQVDDIENEPDDYVEDMSKSVLHENQVDDIDSEPDSYVDALNTIESESETDHEYQTKREVEPCLPKIGDTEMRVSVEEPMSHSTVHHDSSIRPDGTSSITSDNGMPLDLCEPAPPEIAPEVQMLQAAEKLADSDCSPATSAFEGSDVHDGSKIESMIQDSPSSGSSPPVNETMSSSPKPHESPAKLAPANFWTNGSLLGLQPAKPVDFAPPSSADSNALMKTKDITADPADLSSSSKSNGGEDKLGVFGENGNIKGKEASSNYPTSFLIVKDSQSTQKTALVSSLADLYARTDRSGDSNLNNRCGHTNGGGSSTITLVAPGSAMPVAPTAKVVNVESSKENDENSSGVFGLGHRLFVNSFRKKISLVYDEKSDLASSGNARMMERDRDEHCATYETRQEKTKGEQFEIRSPIQSLPPSPPLEHMKISFHPVNDFETSKMGLRFSDDRSCQESIRDMFASFQLVPEPSLLLRDVGSDSDDDTFCRSSPCMSDDCLSRNSDSNSEQWESGGNSGMKEHDQYDALCRLSSSEFASAPSEQVGLDSYGNFVKEVGSQQADNGVEPLLSYPTAVSGSALNIPSFDTFQSLPKAEYDRESDQKNSLPPQPPGQPAPPPPPLPPAEWRASKPNADMGEEEQQTSEGSKDAAYSKHSVSTVSVQPQPALSNQHHIVEEFIQVTAERKGQLKFAAKEANQGDNGKVEDEKDDFLRQIRTQSFNLRRTVPAKGTTTAAPNANVKVTAILQKANAIRQAVGSDDGEDDSWSDT